MLCWHHPWRFSRPDWIKFWTTWSGVTAGPAWAGGWTRHPEVPCNLIYPISQSTEQQHRFLLLCDWELLVRFDSYSYRCWVVNCHVWCKAGLVAYWYQWLLGVYRMLWLLSLRSGSCRYCSDKSLAQRGSITNCTWEPTPGRNVKIYGNRSYFSSHLLIFGFLWC